MSVHTAAESLPGLCRSLLQAGIGLALQSTLLLGLGLLAGWALRRRGPALVSLIYRATLLGALLSGLMSICLGSTFRPLWQVSLPPAVDAAGMNARAGGVPGAGIPGELWVHRVDTPGAATSSPVLTDFPESANHSVEEASSRAESGRSTSAAPAISRREVADGDSAMRRHGFGWFYVAGMGVWAAGTLGLLLWLLLCQLHLRRIRRNSRLVAAGDVAVLAQRLGEAFSLRPPLLLVSPAVRTPFLAGIRRPAIFLPAGYEAQFDAAALRLILAHELVHLARQDCAWNLLARIACAVGWVQPLLWRLCRRLEQVSEELCDQEVVRREGDPRAYADCLLRLSERLLPSGRERVLAVGVVLFRSSLGRRIQEIMARPRPRPLPAGLRALVGLGAVLAAALGFLLIPGAAVPSAGGADSPSARASGRQHSVLEQVRELEKPVTYTETKIPLGELVQKVSADTGVKLAAAAEVADEPVAVVVRDLPARELLEQVADLLDYRWARRGTEGAWRYEIWQDVAGKRAEGALREAAKAQAWQRLLAQIPLYVRMAARPPAEIERLLAEEKRWADRMRQLPYAQRLAVDMQDRTQQRRFMMAEQVASPVARSEAALLGRLTPAQWAVLRQGQPLVFSTEPQAGEILLPAEIARALRGAQPRMDNPTHYGSLERQKAERERRQHLIAAWAEATGYRVRITLDTSRFQSDGELSLQASAIPLRGRRPVLPDTCLPANGAMLGVGVGPSYVFPWGADEPDEKAGALRRTALANDPVLGAKQPLTVDVKPRGPEEPYWNGVSGLGEMLPDVARIYGVSLISDAYNGDRTTTRFSSATPVALYDLLDRLAGDRHTWDHHGRLVRFRYRAWPFARPQEVPMRLLRRWQDLLDREGALPWEEWQTIATLNDLQLDTLFHWAMFRGPGAFVAPVDPRYALRLYASLTPGQQQALRQGRPLPIAGMTPAQQALFLATLREQAQVRPGIVAPGSEPSLGPDAAFSLSSECKVWIFKRHGNWTGIYYEPVSETTAAAPAAAPRSPSPARSSVTRRTITTLTFRFQSGSRGEERVFLYTSSKGVTQ